MKHVSDSRKPKPERSQVIRLGKGQADKLEKLAELFNVTQAQLVRWAVDAMERKIQSMGNKMTLPFDFDTPEDSLSGMAEDVKKYRAKKK